MELQTVYHILAGLLFFGAFSLVVTSPLPDTFDNGDMQSDDDYQYSDDEGVAVGHTKSTTSRADLAQVPYFKENDLTVSTIVGKNATLQCAANNLSENNVILWYKGDNVISTGNQLLNQDFALDPKNFALTIVNATEASQGKYVCEVQPQRIRLTTTLVVSEHPIEAIIPESSKSAQESLHFKSTTSLLISSVIGILLFLRI